MTPHPIWPPSTPMHTMCLRLDQKQIKSVTASSFLQYVEATPGVRTHTHTPASIYSARFVILFILLIVASTALR